MTSPPDSGTELPAELTARPLALVAVSGLDTVNNAVHRAVWEALGGGQRAAERALLRCQLLHNTFELPVVKPKRTSYEWYIPKGILKRNWMKKRLSLVPAVIVVFYDMEWDDPQWNERMIECASRVQSIRAACEGHGTRVAVVVLQAAPAPPPTECPLGAERAQALCAACDLQSKALFVVPHGAQLAGYAARLEAALCDLAHGYYHHEARAVRSHRDLLNKTTHQYLLVRHQFKLGFLNELKQDLSAAHKHYSHAYSALLEARVVDTNVHEVRTVAGFINYKLCRLLFALNLPRDAIAQQRAHVDRYRGRTGSNELLFEHYAWLARQHAAFGDLFDEAVRGGLPATRSQHPGFYYQQAAALTGSRRRAMRAVCPADAAPPSLPPPPDPPTEYYGQRAWRPGRLGAEPHDAGREAAGVLALQLRERAVDHSALIVSFLGAAIAQFKMFHSPRARNQLVVQMADEYYYSADYGKALTLLAHMLCEYRRERWWALAGHVAARALQCAYLAARLTDYLQLAVQALSPHAPAPHGDRVLRNITALLHCQPPEPEPDVPPHAAEAARALWAAAVASPPLLVTVDMPAEGSFLQVKPRWTRRSYRVDEPALCEVHVRLLHATRLRVHRALLTLATHSAHTVDVPLTPAPLHAPADSPAADHDAGVLLESDKVNKFTCTFTPRHADSGTDVHIKNVSFSLYSDSKRKLVLNFKMDGSKESSGATHPELLHLMLSPRAQHEFACVVPLTTAALTARESRLALSARAAGPALQGEWYPAAFTLANEEDGSLADLTVTVSLRPAADSPDPVTELAASPGAPHPLPLALPAPLLPPRARTDLLFYLKTSRVATVQVEVRACYSVHVAGAGRVECVKEFTMDIAVIKPFQVSASCVAMDLTPITRCYVDAPFVVVPHITVLSPCDLVIEHTELELTEWFRRADAHPAPCVRALRVPERGVAVDVVCVRALRVPPHASTRLGLYNMTWRRADSPLSACVRSSSALTAPAVAACGVAARVECPAAVTLRGPLGVTCVLRGAGGRAVRLVVAMEGTDAFMFAGYRRAQVTVAPGAEVRLHYSLLPLLAGPAAPPRLTATLLDPAPPGEQEALTEMFDTIFPHRIFVMPANHTHNSLPDSHT